MLTHLFYSYCRSMGYQQRNVGRRHSGHQGMSLVEVTVAMGLASVMFLGVTQMAGYALKSSRNVSQITEWSELRNNVRSVLRSPYGCTRTMRLLHDSSGPLVGDTSAANVLAADTSLMPATARLVRPKRNTDPLPEPPFNLPAAGCASPAIPFMTLTGTDRIAEVGRTNNALQTTCIWARAVNIGEATTWSLAPGANLPNDIPSSAGGVPNARMVTYELRIAARKIAIAGAEGGNLGGAGGEYSETFRISAWVNAQTGKVLECSEAQTACESLGGNNITHDPSCVFENWIVGQTNPTSGAAWDFAQSRINVALGNADTLNPAGGIHSRSGLVIPVVANGALSNTNLPTRGGITFDNGKALGANMAAIRVASPTSIAGMGAAAPTSTSTTGTLWILGQPNFPSTTVVPTTGDLDNRRVGIRGSGGIELQGELRLTDPRKTNGTRQVGIGFGGVDRDSELPAALVIDTNPDVPNVRGGEFQVQTETLTMQSDVTFISAASRLSLAATAPTGAIPDNENSAQLDLVSSDADGVGLHFRGVNRMNPGTQVLDLIVRPGGGTGTAYSNGGLTIASAGFPAEEIEMRFEKRPVMSAAPTAVGTLAFGDTGGRNFQLLPGTASLEIRQTTLDGSANASLLTIGTSAAGRTGHLRLEGPGTIQTGTGPRWRVLAMERVGILFVALGGNVTGGTRSRSINPNGCPLDQIIVNATLERPGIRSTPDGSTPPITTDNLHMITFGLRSTSATAVEIRFQAVGIHTIGNFQVNYSAFCVSP